MSLMFSAVIFSFLLGMAAGGGLSTNSASSTSAAATAYWQKMLPNTPMPSAILELLTPPADHSDHNGNQKINDMQTGEGTGEKYVQASFLKARKVGLHSTTKEANKKGEKFRLLGRDTDTNDKKYKVFHPFHYGGDTSNHNNKVFHYRLDTNTKDRKNNVFHYSLDTNTNDQKNKVFHYGPNTNTDDQSNKVFHYASDTHDQKNKVFHYDPDMNTHDKKNTVFHYGPDMHTDDQSNKVFHYGADTNNYDQKNKLVFHYGPNMNTDDQNNKVFHYSSDLNTHNQKNNVFHYGRDTNTHGENNKVSHYDPAAYYHEKNKVFHYGPDKNTHGQKNKVFHYGPETNSDDQNNKVFHYGLGTNTQNQNNKVFHYGQETRTHMILRTGFTVYGPDMKNTDNQKNKVLAELARNNRESLHIHGDFTTPFFTEEVLLTPGSTITPYIPSSSTSGALLLQRDVAASVPMSTRNFTDILTMYAPMSDAMAKDTWSALDFCENSLPVKGEKRTCATSLESMVEFAASVLTGGSTGDLRAFSSPNVPVEGIMSGRYKVSAAPRTTELSESVTCHAMSFPFPVFMCHAVNPTRVYTVALQKEDVGGAMGLDKMVEAIAVCHLDTSDFNPRKMPAHVRPGDAPICHFIARNSILWAPATTTAAAA